MILLWFTLKTAPKIICTLSYGSKKIWKLLIHTLVLEKILELFFLKQKMSLILVLSLLINSKFDVNIFSNH